jgi:hypothetical protein
MKFTLISAALAFILVVPATAQRRRPPQKQQPPPAEEKKPSRKETFDFLKETIPANAYYKGMSKSGVAFDYRVEDVQFDGCTMAVKSVTVMTVNDEAGGSAFTIVNTNNDVDKVALNNLDVRQVAVKIPESTPPVTSGVMISMHTLNNQDLVHSHSETRSYSTVSGSSAYAKDMDFSSIQIYFTDKDMASRIAHAFEHAIGLCAAKKEPF